MTKIQYWNYQLPQRAVDLPYADRSDTLRAIAQNIDWVCSHLQPNAAALTSERDDGFIDITDWDAELRYFTDIPASNMQVWLFNCAEHNTLDADDFADECVIDWCGNLQYRDKNGNLQYVTDMIEAITDCWESYDADEQSEDYPDMPIGVAEDTHALWQFYLADHLAAAMTDLLQASHPQLNFELHHDYEALNLILDISKPSMKSSRNKH